MNHRQKFDIKKYVAVFAITTLIFIVGILIGNYFSSQKLEQIDYIGQNLKTDTIAMELQYDLIAEDPCSHINSTPLADELYEMASKLDYMENRLGEDNEDVKEIKRTYSLLELRHWLFMKKSIKECNQTSSLILFFYSNEDECPQCKEQGFILTWARKNYKDVYVYSFDYNIQNVALDTVKEIHGVKGVPAVVVDKQTFNRFVTRDELEEVLKQDGLEIIPD
jgi:glutaredoxin